MFKEDEATKLAEDHDAEEDSAAGLDPESDVTQLEDRLENEIADAKAFEAEAKANANEISEHQKRMVERENLDHELLQDLCPPGYVPRTPTMQESKSYTKEANEIPLPPCPVAVLDAPCPCVLERFESGPPMEKPEHMDEEHEILIETQEKSPDDVEPEKTNREVEEEELWNDLKEIEEESDDVLEPAKERKGGCAELEEAVKEKVMRI
eukprot:Gregarina_sp_Poly_1__2893@NODE_1808_length_3293_cov_7_772784_g1173_i0_p2_GENE_NODE_1808_length_3293_cov_7_772784_g1173_i0NODE_1808_length_3293_cov_7_772784_g1173_i0_p2_ORF_typecomplete_len209_score51_74SMC_N/PF02463_19/0_79_NODE_1808_length_3293_cov_7_772784_g1173_i03911017